MSQSQNDNNTLTLINQVQLTNILGLYSKSINGKGMDKNNYPVLIHSSTRLLYLSLVK